MDDEELRNLEKAVELSFTSQDIRERVECSQKLESYASGPDSLKSLLEVLNRTSSQLCFHFACASIHRIYSEFFNSFSEEARQYVRQSLLPLIVGRTDLFYTSNDTSKLARESFCKLCARVWRLSWFEIPYHLKGNGETAKEQAPVNDGNPSVIAVALDIVNTDSNLFHIATAILLLSELIFDMNVSINSLHIVKQKKISNSFKDLHLLSIYVQAVDTIKKLMNTEMSSESPSIVLLESSLDLCLSVLGFNFSTIYVDEASEDIGPIHLKVSWSEALYTTPTFFQIYLTMPSPFSSKALEVIVYLVAIRGVVLKTEDAQIDYLKSVFENLSNILEREVGLDVPQNRHNICRLFARLKNNYRLEQFIKTRAMKPLFKLYSTYCSNLFKSHETNLSTIFYVFNFWNKVAHGIQTVHVNREVEAVVQNLIPMFLDAIIQRELDLNHETLLDDKELQPVLDCLNKIAYVGDFKVIAQELQDRIVQLGKTFQEISGSNDFTKLSVLEKELAWLIYFLGPLMYSKSSSSNELDIVTGKLTSSVFLILDIHNQRLSTFGNTGSSHHLELAILNFLIFFTKSFLSNENTFILKQLSESHGLSTPEALSDKILAKILDNLEMWKSDKTVLTTTFDAFIALTHGRQSATTMGNSQLARRVLSHHNEIQLNISKRLRVMFYKALGKIAYSNLESGLYDEFISKFVQSLSFIENNLNNNYFEGLEAVGPLSCNLRGYLSSCLSSRSYDNFFEWFYKRGFYTSVIHRSITYFINSDYQIVWSLLRFVADVTDNMNRRISFSNTSTDGIRLFKDTANILIELEKKINQQRETADPDITYKSIYYFYKIFSNLVDAEYCNHGVFILYGDDIIHKLLSSLFAIMFNFPLEEIYKYTKIHEKLYLAVSKIFVFNLSALFMKDTNRSLGNPVETISRILETIKFGFKCRIPKVVNYCSIALEQISTSYLGSIKKRSRYPPILEAAHFKILTQALLDLFDMLITEKNVGSIYMYKAMFYLVQLMPDSFQAIKEMMIKSQGHSSVEKAAKMEQSFNELIDGIERNTNQDNQERFCRNVSSFRSGVRHFIDLNMFYKGYWHFIGTSQ